MHIEKGKNKLSRFAKKSSNHKREKEVVSVRCGKERDMTRG